MLTLQLNAIILYNVMTTCMKKTQNFVLGISTFVTKLLFCSYANDCVIRCCSGRNDRYSCAHPPILSHCEFFQIVYSCHAKCFIALRYRGDWVCMLERLSWRLIEVEIDDMKPNLCSSVTTSIISTNTKLTRKKNIASTTPK